MAALSQCANVELLMLPDCGGLLENGKCRWQKIPECLGVNCSFYEKANSLSKAHDRLRSLDDESQERIAQKYYGGTRPWMDTCKKPWN